MCAWRRSPGEEAGSKESSELGQESAEEALFLSVATEDQIN